MKTSSKTTNPFARGGKKTAQTSSEEQTMSTAAKPAETPTAPATSAQPAAAPEAPASSVVVEQPKAPAAAPAAPAPAQAGGGESPASFAQLKELFGTDSGGAAMIVEAQSAGWTYTQAASEGLKKLRAQNAQLQAGQSRLGHAADAGVPAVGTAPGAGGGLGQPESYDAAVKAEMVQSNCKLHEAVDRVNKKFPDLRAKSCGYDPKTGRPSNYRA